MAVNRTSLDKAESAEDSGSPFDTRKADLDEGGDESASLTQKAKKTDEDGREEAAADDNADDDGFDPFKIASIAKTKKLFKRGSSKSNNNNNTSAATVTSVSSVLPPRLDMKFRVNEEVTSGPSLSNLNEGACDVYVSGTVLAQQTSSDALKNAPFVLVAVSQSGAKLDFKPNDTYTKIYSTQGEKGHVHVIKIPKSVVGFVELGKFQISETVDHMPMLLEKKITKTGNQVQMAFQVRSKLTNLDDLNETTLAVAMDTHVIGDSVAITSGKGEWDRAKRTIVWTVNTLPKGESFMVTARARVGPEGEVLSSEDLKFPVMMRCKSQDQISTVKFQAIEASGYPATISSSISSKNFRLIHRLN